LCWQTVEQQFNPALAIASAVIANVKKQNETNDIINFKTLIMSYYDWTEIVKKNTNTELAQIIRNQNSETEEKVAAALIELQSRGIETNDYSQMIESIKNNEPKLDENAPTLYSDRVIYTFSILFSVIFGGILFARNLKEVDNKTGIYPVIIFSVLYTALSIYLLNLINAGTGGTFVLGALGAIIINNLFWNKYIGKGRLYHKKSYRKPLIIALAIFTPIVALVIWATIVTGPQ